MSQEPSSTAGQDIVLGQLLTAAFIGGAENVVVNIMNSHARLGRSAHLVVQRDPDILSSRFDGEVEQHYLYFQRASIRNPFKFALSLVRGFRLLSAAVTSNKIDVLQTHLPDTNLLGLAMALAGKCKVVITIHNNKFLLHNEGTRLGYWVMYHAYRLMVRKCEVVVVSHDVRKSLLEGLKLTEAQASRVKVIDNGVPIPEPLSVQEKHDARRKHSISEDAVWIVAAGRLAEAKNFQCLIRAAAEMRDKGIAFSILIAGNGPQRNELEQLIQDLDLGQHVSLPGNLDDLKDIMRSADILAMSSRWEGLPLVLLESMASGLPVVGTQISGLMDVIQEGEQGFLVEVEDHKALADRLITLISDPELRKTMGRKALQLAKDKYDFERTYAELTKVYETALRR